MKKYKFGFVILHYMSYEMTKKCVNSLLSTFDSELFDVVVVDNCSPNGSGRLLKEDYRSYQNIEVLLNIQNDGFAVGNNKGYKRLLDKDAYDFIIVMNNDVIIDDSLFFDKVFELYVQTNFSVLGPDVINPQTKRHQNPKKLKPYSYREVKERYYKYLIKSRIPHISYLVTIIKKKRLVQSDRATSFSNQVENVVLHGSCLIFSKSYITVRKTCFNPKTFLFHEEDILYFECIKSNLKMVYSPIVQIKHYEDVATDESFKTSFEKEKRMNIWLRDSAKILLEEMKDFKDE